MEKKVEQVRFANPKQLQRKRVAAYARVSSGKDAMLHSLSARIGYYSFLIQSHPDWEYCGVYSDEAISGTKNERPGFRKLVDDCKAGRLDMIITKSISRFARNTLTLLETIRLLKTLGINVYFEEQNIHSMSSDGELLLTILAAYAQEESHSVSENMKWRIRSKFEEGKPWNCTMLGYRYNGEKLVVVPEEAAVVQRIFRDFLSGKGTAKIANGLLKENVSTRFGKEWHRSTIQSILTNYAYTGNLLLQTTFRADCIAKKRVKNRGELPSFYVQMSHEPIVSPDDFEAVQLEIARRAETGVGVHAPERHPFSQLIICGNCGKHFRRKNTPGGHIWSCATYNTRGKRYCSARQIPEKELERITLDLLNEKKLTYAGLRSRVKTILANNGNELVFNMTNGETIVRYWEIRSRSESWTDEMKAEA